MLSKDILAAVRAYTESMQQTVKIVLQTGDHEKHAELKDFLTALAGVSDRLVFEARDTAGLLQSPISFLLERDGTDTGIRFSGIPGGHEFNSLILALLHAGGAEMKLDPRLREVVQAIDEDLRFEVFVSLSCHNCPDVVQALNQFALLNPRISTEMIDGGLFPELIAEREIQGVPSVYLNGEAFGSGKVEAGLILDKLIERDPAIADTGDGNALPLQDMTVIGGGPAGVSAAIYAARKGLAVTIVADRFGGQVKDTMGIENLISVPSTTGPQVVGGLTEHMRSYDITLKEHVRVDAIESGEIKTLRLSSGEAIRTRTVIIATGARWRELGVPGERENIGNGVAYCPHCDGPFFKDKDVAVIGGGNSGIEAALDLAGIVKSVTVLEFAPELKADRVLVEQARNRPNIEIRTNAATQRIKATDSKVSGLRYENRADGSEQELDVAAVFVQIGLVPNSQFATSVVDTTDYGEIVIDDKCRTSEPGIYACGDVTTVPYKQIVVAMGEGSKAALAAFEYLLATSIADEIDVAA